MKNIFKAMSLMLAASTLMLTSCKPDENPIDPVNPVAKYTISVSANDPAMGTVSGAGEYEENTTATLTATANEGYKFVNWDDGNTTNPRLVTVTANASYIANFEALAGVNVTFGTTTWSAGYVNSQLAANAVMVAAAQTNATSYPICNMTVIWDEGVTPGVGTYTGAHQFELGPDGRSVSIYFGNAYVWYYESTGIQLSTTTAGDWWSKDCTANITTLDADAMNLSMVVNAEMAHVTELFNAAGELTSLDLNSVTARSLTGNIINQSMTQYGAKVLVAKKATAALAK